MFQSKEDGQAGTAPGQMGDSGSSSDGYVFKVLWPVVGWFHMAQSTDASTTAKSLEDPSSETPTDNDDDDDSSVAAELGRQLQSKGSGSRLLIRRCSQHEQNRWRKSVRHSVAMRVESLPQQEQEQEQKKAGASRATSKVHPVSTLSALDEGNCGKVSPETLHPGKNTLEGDFLQARDASGYDDEDACVLLMKLWPRAGTIDALFHDRLDPKFTWQVIAETGGFSYNIWKHTKYVSLLS